MNKLKNLHLITGILWLIACLCNIICVAISTHPIIIIIYILCTLLTGLNAALQFYMYLEDKRNGRQFQSRTSQIPNR